MQCYRKSLFNICMSRSFHFFITVSIACLTFFFFPLKETATKTVKLEVNPIHFHRHVSIYDYKQGLFFERTFITILSFQEGVL